MANFDSGFIVRKAFENIRSESRFASTETIISRIEKLSQSLSLRHQRKIWPLLISAKSLTQPLTLRRDYGERESGKWKGKPDGWTSESRSQFWNSLTGDVKHKVTKCMTKMEGKVSNPGAFCASLRDRVEGKGWRQEAREARDEEAALDIEPTKRSEWPEIPEGNKAAGGCGCGCGGNCSGCDCDSARLVRAEVQNFAYRNPKLAKMLIDTLQA